MHCLLQKLLERWQAGALSDFHSKAVPYSKGSMEEF